MWDSVCCVLVLCQMSGGETENVFVLCVHVCMTGL